jgi:hypothetical protein
MRVGISEIMRIDTNSEATSYNQKIFALES